MTHDLEEVASALVADGKGILAADETPHTLTKRFDTLGILSTEKSRCIYREMLFTADVADFISGVILQDETIRQRGSDGTPLIQTLSKQGILPGIKVDAGAKPLAGAPGETVTEGLDGLRERLAEYRDMGARFAKWRAVIHISDVLPSHACISANAHAVSRYAVLCQEQNLVPIVEPEVLMDGAHTIGRCEAVTGAVLFAVFSALHDQGVWLERMLLKPNMVIAGKPRSTSVQEVATATLRCLRRHTGARVDRVIARVRAVHGNVALFAHGHVLRVLVARWIGFPPAAGERFLLDTGTVCVLSYYYEIPAVRVWNGSLPITG